VVTSAREGDHMALWTNQWGGADGLGKWLWFW